MHNNYTHVQHTLHGNVGNIEFDCDFIHFLNTVDRMKKHVLYTPIFPELLSNRLKEMTNSALSSYFM